MARTSSDINVRAVAKEFAKIPLSQIGAQARKEGANLSAGGLQKRLAVLAMHGGQMAKAKGLKEWTFDEDFAEFEAAHYRDGDKLGDEARKTILRAYNGFADAGIFAAYDATPYAIQCLEAKDLGISTRGGLVKKILKAFPKDPPSASKVVELIKASQDTGDKSKTKVNVKAKIKGLASAADRLAASGKFWTALNKADKPKAAGALVTAMHLLTIARHEIDPGDATQKSRDKMDALLAKHAAAQYKAAKAAGATFH